LTTASRWPGRRVVSVTGRLAGALVPWWWRQRRGGFPGPESGRADVSRRLREAAEALGPTFIKLGQIVSSGEGLFPTELVAEFKKCRDQVPAESFAVVQATVEADLGRPLSAVFASFDPAPVAAASIAQVHAATLLDGTGVVVKVQRPQVDRLVRADLRAMSWLAPHLIGRIPVAALANPPAIVELFAETIVEELDFRLEAANMLDIATILRELGQDGYVVPRPHPTLVTRRVLVMERLSGFAFDDVAGMRGAGIDTEAVIRTGMIAFMEVAMVHGVFHGDLHGGNLFVLPDGRTALLDFGIVGRLSPLGRQAFLRLMLGAITNDVTGQLAALRDLGALPGDTDLAAVIRDLRLDQAVVDPTTLSGEEMVKEVQRVVKALLGYGARLPKELVLYVKNLVFLDGAIARLAPDLDLLAEVGAISVTFTQRHGDRLGRELGIDPRTVTFDFDGVKASMGLDASVDRFTYRELQQRRQLIQDRLGSQARPPRRRARRPR
jgi:ubiquinone biosynthesis protein